MLNQVLLVDDSKSARFALRKLLERSGLQVDVAENAEQALKYLEAHHPDLIFMDHFMPGMDGFEAAREIKSRPDKAAIPIIMCTSREGEDYVREARENGALAILPKPATPATVAELLENVQRSIETALSTPVAEATAEFPSESSEALSSTVEAESDKALQERIERYASQWLEIYAEQRIQTLLEAKVPQLRESVLSNFDKIAKLILRESLGNELQNLKQQLKDELSATVSADTGVTASEIDNLLQGSLQQLYERFQRETNEQVAEIYSSIGELKRDRQLRKIAPELMEDIQASSREAAAEQANDLLLQASDVAQKTATQVAEELSAKIAGQTSEQWQGKQAKVLQNGLDSVRLEAE